VVAAPADVLVYWIWDIGVVCQFEAFMSLGMLIEEREYGPASKVVKLARTCLAIMVMTITGRDYTHGTQEYIT